MQLGTCCGIVRGWACWECQLQLGWRKREDRCGHCGRALALPQRASAVSASAEAR